MPQLTALKSIYSISFVFGKLFREELSGGISARNVWGYFCPNMWDSIFYEFRDFSPIVHRNERKSDGESNSNVARPLVLFGGSQELAFSHWTTRKDTTKSCGHHHQPKMCDTHISGRKRGFRAKSGWKIAFHPGTKWFLLVPIWHRFVTYIRRMNLCRNQIEGVFTWHKQGKIDVQIEIKYHAHTISAGPCGAKKGFPLGS